MSWWGRVCLVLAAGACLLSAPLPASARTPLRDRKPAMPKIAPTPSDVHHYVLHPVGDGSYVYPGAGFSATIAADGTVTFREPKATRRSRTEEIIMNTGEGRRPEVWPVPLPDVNRPTPYDYKDTARAIDPITTPTVPLAQPIFVDVGARFDLTDLYARSLGHDPYQTAKATFLADTFDFRMKMAARQHRLTTGVALAELPRELEAIWNDPRFSATERSRIVFLLWQETSDDADGLRARQIIQDFAGKNLPPQDAARFQTRVSN